MGNTTRTMGALGLLRCYGLRGIILFLVLAAIIGSLQLCAPPVYSARATAQVGSLPSSPLASPMALLSSDNIEDELAVLESVAIRQHTSDLLHLECRPEPAWQPSPFGYQFGRVMAFIFRLRRPLDYGKLAYPTTTQLELDYDKVAKQRLLISLDGEGSYTLSVGRRQVDTKPVGEPLSTTGLSIVLDGFTPGRAQRWRLCLTEPGQEAAALRDAVTVLRVGARSNTVGIGCEAPHPELAARIVNTMMDYYIQRDVEVKQRSSSEMLVYIDQQIETVDAQLDGQRAAMNELLGDRGNLIASGGPELVSGSYLTSQDRLSALLTERAQVQQLRTRLDGDQPLTGYHDSLVLDRPVETEIAQSILSSEQLLAEELLVKTDEHPDVQELRQTIASQRASLAQLLDESLGQLEQRVSATRRDMGRYEALLDLSPEAKVELGRLNSEIAIATEILATLYAERQQAALQQESDVSPITVLDRGVPNHRPARPRLSMAAFTSVIAALLLTAAVLLAAGLLDRDLRDPAALSVRFGAPLLAILDAAGQPATPLEAKRLRLRATGLLQDTDQQLALVAMHNGEHATRALATLKLVLAESGPSADELSQRLRAAAGTGSEALYDSALGLGAAVVLITSPGRRRLTELAVVVAELRELGHTLAGFVFITT